MASTWPPAIIRHAPALPGPYQTTSPADATEVEVVGPHVGEARPGQVLTETDGPASHPPVRATEAADAREATPGAVASYRGIAPLEEVRRRRVGLAQEGAVADPPPA